MNKVMTVLMAAGLSAGLFAQETFERRIEHKIIAGAGDGAGAVFFQQGAGNVAVRVGGAEQTMEFVGMELASAGRTVKGAPYSAEAITESVQMLADGNRITHRQTAQLWRDSEGRTRRQERIGGRAEKETVLINDPVAGVHYVLNTDARTANRIQLPGGAVVASSGEGSRVMLRRSPAPAAGAGASVEVFRSTAGAVRAKSEPLGKRIIEGVEAEGTRTVRTIAAGEIGNERPIEIVSERWYSNELQMTVMTRTVDPRSGETTFRISGLQRGEPMRSLFEVPSDYTVRDGAFTMIDKKIEVERK